MNGSYITGLDIYISIYIFIYFSVFYLDRRRQPGRACGRRQDSGIFYYRIRPLHDIRLLQRFCARANHHLSAPPTCNTHTVAIVLHDCCAGYAPPPTHLVIAIHHTILVMAILCKGQYRI